MSVVNVTAIREVTTAIVRSGNWGNFISTSFSDGFGKRCSRHFSVLFSNLPDFASCSKWLSSGLEFKLFHLALKKYSLHNFLILVCNQFLTTNMISMKVSTV